MATPSAWLGADAAANGLSLQGCQGHLATILSADENDFIVTKMPQVAVPAVVGEGLQGGYWIGGFQPAGSGEPGSGWTWVNGGCAIPLTNAGPGYGNWAGVEPNDLGGEDRLQFFGGHGGIGVDDTKWNDEAGFKEYGYVVEYECGS